MSVSYSLDDVARTTDDAAVRARFDASTLTALRFVAIVCLPVGFGHFVEAGSVFRLFLGGSSFLLAAAVLFAIRQRYRARIRPRPLAMAFVIVETGLIVLQNALAGNETVAVFGTVAPLIILGYRLLPAEQVLTHLSLAATYTTIVLMNPIPRAGLDQLLTPPLLTNASALAVSLFISRRIRKRVVNEWSERRTSAREQIRMRDELRYARELQLSMLPEHAPQLGWADIASISIPATEVGGDYYDYFVEDQCVTLVCGDVAGHGMSSGLVLSALRGGFMLLSESLRDPAAILERLHTLVAKTTRRRMLVTAAVVLLDHQRRRAIIASAGHPPVLIRRADGSIVSLNLYAPPLGVRLPIVIPQREVDFAPGDMFILHSDGIYETRNEADEVYGLERLERIVSEQGGTSAEALRDAILSDISAFRGAIEQDDDVTVVVCKIAAP